MLINFATIFELHYIKRMLLTAFCLYTNPHFTMILLVLFTQQCNTTFVYFFKAIQQEKDMFGQADSIFSPLLPGCRKKYSHSKLVSFHRLKVTNDLGWRLGCGINLAAVRPAHIDLNHKKCQILTLHFWIELRKMWNTPTPKATVVVIFYSSKREHCDQKMYE